MRPRQVGAQHERAVVDRAQLQRFHDALDDRQVRAVDLHMAVLVHGASDPFQGGAQLARGDGRAPTLAVGPEVGVLRVQRAQHSVGEVQHVVGEGLAALRLGPRVLRQQREDVPALDDLDGLGALPGLGDAVHLAERVDEGGGEGVAADLQLTAGLGPVVGRVVAGELGEPVAFQQEADPDQLAELRLALLGEEVGQPHQGGLVQAVVPELLVSPSFLTRW